jgi:2-amino-4-hydroxy-6-hydroxymethyldihydropteridine diphosphokinase
MPLVLLGLGGNTGDVRQTCARALELLGTNGTTVVRVSSWHATAPAGGPTDQTAYVNGAAVVRSTLTPVALLQHLQRTEEALGRQRTTRWGPRTIDIDILLYDDLELVTPELTVPHPRLECRLFALDPACEIAADWVHPIHGWTLSRIREHLRTTSRRLAICGSGSEQACGQLRSEAAEQGWELLTGWHSTARVQAVLTQGRTANKDVAIAQYDRLRREPSSPPVLWIDSSDPAWQQAELQAVLVAAR